MSGDDRVEPAIDETAATAGKPASRALVPVVPFVERRSRKRSYRWAPDPIFVTHLIAAAERVPQARHLRRASMTDAQAAYRPQPMIAENIGSRMRQVV